MNRSLLIKAVAALGMGLSHVQDAQEETILLRLQPTDGATYDCTVATENTISATGIDEMKKTTTLFGKQRYSVKPNGNIVMVTTIDKVESDDPAAQDSKGLTMKITVTPLYEFKEFKTEGGKAETREMFDKTMAISAKLSSFFPEKAVKVGDSWASKFNLGEMFEAFAPGVIKVKGDPNANIEMKLTKIETVDGAKRATVTMHMDHKLELEAGPKALNAELAMDTTSTYDVATGIALLTVGTTAQNMSDANGGMKMSSKVTTNLKPTK